MSNVDVLPPKAHADLEWARVLFALEARCVTAPGREMARDLSPPERAEDALLVAEETREAMLADNRAEPLPIVGAPDIRAAYDRAAHAGVLSGPELRSVSEFLGGVRTLRRYLRAHRDELPSLWTRCGTDAALDVVEDHIAHCFDPDGTLADHASPELKALRAEYRAARGRMVSRIEELIRRYRPILQDDFWTEREGRYVLPVRSDAHERFPGIVHASSASGSTLFVEPRVLVPVGNRLKMLEGEVRRAEEAVYTQLTGRLVEVLPSLAAAIEAFAVADLRAATAMLAREVGLTYPTLPPADQGFVAKLRGLRHPLLLLEHLDKGRAQARATVVPSDIDIAQGRALVVSGPNAGGKTVALKALGLSAIMLRCGLPVPCDEGSTLGLVETVLTDVGDDQSLQKSLSTFSAHVDNLARILDAARPFALVLLDELAGGTDPREGEALAAAVLDGLCRRGAAVVCTTHYEGLKTLALHDPRFQNASVGFDERTLSPTFRLTIGVPGASSALSVARRFGIPSLVIERAEAYLSGGERSFEESVRALNEERRALELARTAAEDELRKVRETREELERELSELRTRERRVLEKETEALFLSLRRAREDVRRAQASLRGRKVEPDALREADRALDGVASKVAVGGELGHLLERPGQVPPVEDIDSNTTIERGTRVYVPRLRAEAEVLAVLGDGQLRLAAGAMKLTLPRTDVKLLGVRARSRPQLPNSEGEPLPSFPGAESLPALQTSNNTCDIRGLRVEDGWGMVETFLDRSLTAHERVVFIIHGHGSGALRDKIRESLRSSRYVARFRPGLTSEGGDGVTVVWLA